MTAVQLGSLTVSAATGGRRLGDDAPVVVLVHGAGMDRTVWALQTRWLAHHGFDALAVDLPGHGASTEDERESIVDYADWLGEVVAGIARPVHLVGHSMGSFIVAEAAATGGAASVTLIGTAAAMPVHPVLVEAAGNDDPLAAQLMSGWGLGHHTRMAPNPSPGASMIGATLAVVAQSRPGVLHSDLVMCAAYDGMVTAAEAFDGPATLLLGAEDRMTPPAKAAPIADAYANARTVTAPGVGHMIQIEAPRLTRQTIAETATAAAQLTSSPA